MEDKNRDKNVSAKDMSKDKSSGSGGSSKDSKDSKGKSGGSKDSKGGKSSPPINKRSSNGGGNIPVNPEPDNQDTAGADSLQLVLSELKSLASSQKQQAIKIGERMDSQAAQISFLTDEWNLKVANNSKNDKIGSTEKEKVDKSDQRDLAPYSGWNTDSDDEKLEETIADYDDEEEESDGKEEEEDDFDEVLYGKDQKGIIPSKEEIAVFKKRTKLADEFAEDEWREIKSKQVAKFFVGRPEARDFAGPRADTDCPDLKEMSECMKQVGAINLAQIRLAEEAKNLVATAGVTMAEFANPDIPMADPRQEASQSMEGVKEAGTEMMKLIGSLGKMSTVVFLKLLTMRRSQFVESVDSSKVAREIVISFVEKNN